MSSEAKPILVGRVWRDPDCAGEPLAEQNRQPDGQVVVSWAIDPETLRGPVWLEVLDENSIDASTSCTEKSLDETEFYVDRLGCGR